MNEELATQTPEPETEIPLAHVVPTTFSTVTSSPLTWNALLVVVEPHPFTKMLLIETSSEEMSNPLPLVMFKVVFDVAFPIIVMLSSTSTFSV